MQLWGVFVTGLVAGGASCAAVQGGLLTGMLARREDPKRAATPGPAATAAGRKRRGKGGTARAGSAKRTEGRARPRARDGSAAPTRQRQSTPRPLRHDLVPVTGFLAGKLVSHTLAGALLGAIGAAVQLGFRSRATTQVIAGIVRVLMALHLLGVRQLRSVVPEPPAAFTRLVRRRARSQAMAGPALLGLLTVLIPCGVTLSVAFLAVAAGSPLTGAAIMAVFVLGTSPLFTAIGFAASRYAAGFGGRLASVTAVAVLGIGLFTVNSGLALGGSPVTLASAFASAVPSDPQEPGKPVYGPVAGPVAPAGGVQRVELQVRDSDYEGPKRVRAGMPTTLTLVTDETQGCTRGFVVPSLGIEEILPETGRTEVDLGVLKQGKLEYTCSMGMYGGTLDVVAA